jgi:membrane protease YdiL (CAAX protease family)
VDFRKQPILESLTPFTRLLFSVLLMIATFSATFLAGMFLAGPLFGVGIRDVMALMTDFEDENTLRLLKYFQVVQSFGLFIFPPLLAGYFFERSSWRYLRLNRSSRLPVYLLTFALMFVSLPFINWMIDLNQSLSLPGFLAGMEAWMKAAEEQAEKLTAAFLEMPTLGSFLFNLFMIALLPAIGEELLFRGLVQRLLREWLGNVHVAIFIAAFLFSALHMQFYGFLPRMMLGVMFGYLFYWSGSLWVPVFAHFINNGSAVVAAWLWQSGMIKSNYEDFGATDNAFLIIVSVLVTAGLLFFIHRFKPASDA